MFGIFGRKRQERRAAKAQPALAQTGASAAYSLMAVGVGPAPFSAFALPGMATGVAEGVARDSADAAGTGTGSFWSTFATNLRQASSIAFDAPQTPMQAAVQEAAAQQMAAQEQAAGALPQTSAGPFWIVPVVALSGVMILFLGAVAFALSGRRRRR